MNSKLMPLIVVESDGLLKSDCVVVGGGTSETREIGLLVTNPGDPLESICPVRLVYDNSLSELIAMGPSTAARCGIVSVDSSDWELRTKGFTIQAISRLELELAADLSSNPEASARFCGSNIDGQLFYLPRNSSCQGLAINILGNPYRVRSMQPQPAEDAVLFVSARETEVSLIVSSHRSGIDVVILADCSGSMGIGDLSPASESASEGASIEPRTFFQKILGRGSSRQRNITRIQAVRDALLQLIEKRRRSYGSSSRLALVAFGSRSELRFPSTGMLEIDENTAEATLQQFRDKIATLSDESDSTNIGQALQFAATHLANCGKVGNERLIVLLSDGADWRPKGVEATGEMLSTALEDPVSLMENLHRAMNVKLHAIGISNQQLYQNFLSRTDRTYVEGHAPNHALLRELMIVGGGDAERIGDSSVLDEYFQGLGVGVSLLVEVRPRTTSKVLSDSERNEIMVRVPKRRQGQSKTTQATLDQSKHTDLCSEVASLYLLCSKKAQHIGSFDLWRGSFTDTTKLLNDIKRPVTDEYSFGTFARDLFNLVDEMLIEEIRRNKFKQPSPLKSQIAKLLHGSKTIGMLAELRHKLGAHIPDPAVADAIEFFSGVRHIPESDSVAWSRLAETVLSSINVVLSQINDALEEFNVVRKAESAECASSIVDNERNGLEINADW